MWRISLSMLTGDKLKYISLIAGLAFCALLVTQQASIFKGYAAQMGAWVRDTSVADLWVMDDQVEFVDDFKPMPEQRLRRIRGIDGVAWAVPMFKSYLPVQLQDGTLVQCRVIGLDDASLIGGPPEYVSGNLESLREDRAVLINIDHAATNLAQRRNGHRAVELGDRLSINDHDAIVAGMYKSQKEFFWDPVIYTTYSRALEWAPRQRKLLTFVLVKAQAGTDVSELSKRITQSTGLAAYTNSEFDGRTTKDLLGRTGILINFGLTIALGVVIGVLIAGQTFYMFVLDNLRHFAALKAMGTGNLTLIGMIFLQAATAGIVGYGLGLGGACLTGAAFHKIGMAFQMTWHIPVVGAAAIILCCLVASLLSLQRVLLLEPAIVFKG